MLKLVKDLTGTLQWIIPFVGVGFILWHVFKIMTGDERDQEIHKKGIIKVADRFFTDEEISRLSVVAPNVKLNIIRDYEVVEKKQVLMPEELRGIVKCANPKCITNNEPMTTLFHVIDKEHGILKCHYCEKEQSKEGIKLL